MSELDLTGLRVFCEIVDAGSFTAAAERMRMAPPMVSKHVARLERQLGARLLNRTSRRMSLTEAGTLFHQQTRQALDALDAGVASLGQASGSPRGELKVSAPVWCATPRFARLIADYRLAFPEVRLDLHLENRMVDIVSEGFDLALRMTLAPSPNLIARPLCAVTFHCVATPDYLRRARAEDGAEHPTPLEIILPNYLQFGRLKLAVPEMRAMLTQPVAMKASDTTLIYHAVMAGMGAAFLLDWLVADDLASGRLRQVYPDHPTLAGRLYAVYPSRRQLPPKLRSFVDFLVARLGPDTAALDGAAAELSRQRLNG
ncbi:MAG: LysR family transcriptional regulator [Pseudomonadota bacterium]